MTRFCLILLAGTVLGTPVEDARLVLTGAAHSREGDQRREAALAVSLVPAKDPAASLIEELLKDKDYQVRVAALNTLGELNDKSRLDLMKSALNDEVPEVVFAAAKALYTLKDPAGVQALASIYGGETRGQSSYFKKEMRDSVRRLKTPRSALLFVVENGVGFVPVPGAGAGYNALSGVLADSDVSARAVSALMLCTDNNNGCDQVLASAFQDEDWTVRASAIHIAASKNLVSFKPAIADLLADKKNKVRVRAAAAYLRLDSVPPPLPPKAVRKGATKASSGATDRRRP